MPPDDRYGLLGIKPIWPEDNPVGTERYGDAELRVAQPGFRPAAFVGGGVWGDERPISQEDKGAVGEGSRWLYDQLSMVAPVVTGARFPGVAGRARFPSVAIEAPRPMPGAKTYMPIEQMPGNSTGLLGLVPGDGRAWSDAATWRDRVTGTDMLTSPMFPQPRMLDTTGTYRNAAGVFEMNPSQAAHLPTSFRANFEPRALDADTEAAYRASLASRGLLDMQEGSPYASIDTRSTVPPVNATSMRVTGVRPTPQQLERLYDAVDRHGYFVSDTGDGISLIHNPYSEKSPADGFDLAQRLQRGLQTEIHQALPGARLQTGRSIDDYYDLSEELALSMRGQGRATDKVLGDLERLRTRAPDLYDKMVDNPMVAQKAQANLDRLTPAMRELRPDYVQLLQTVASGNLRSLVDYVARAGSIGLPAALGAIAAGRDPD